MVNQFFLAIIMGKIKTLFTINGSQIQKPDVYIHKLNRKILKSQYMISLLYVLSYYKTYFPLEFYCEFINLNIKEYNETILNFSNKNIYELTNTYKMHYEDIPEILTLAKEIEDSGYDIITDNNLKVAQKAIIDNGKIKLV